MKLRNNDQAPAPGAGVLSVSLKETEDEQFDSIKNPVNEHDLWELINQELVSDGSPVWRMWC